ncbi:MAG: hypothetical protein DLM52_03730 [Chthoniobacterales bacterium]|nr:MAG: hypothetical protein DLM52_03730 [Chthoniobacterales bacterium]
MAEQARANAEKARANGELYERLKVRVIELTHSQFAIPLLDAIFERPIFRSSSLHARAGMPSIPMVMNMLRRLVQADILRVHRQGSGRRAQVLAWPALLNLCEGRVVF